MARAWKTINWEHAAEVWRFVLPTHPLEFLLLLAFSYVVYVLYESAYAPPAIIINDISVPRDLEQRGYSPHLLAARIADEIRNIQRTARTTRKALSTELSEGKPEIEVRAVVFSLTGVMSFLRPLLGHEDRVVSGALYEDGEGALKLALQGSFSHEGSLREHVDNTHVLDNVIKVSLGIIGTYDMAWPGRSYEDDLPKRAAEKILQAFDPYFVAVYHYQRARYYQGLSQLIEGEYVEGELLENVQKSSVPCDDPRMIADPPKTADPPEIKWDQGGREAWDNRSGDEWDKAHMDADRNGLVALLKQCRQNEYVKSMVSVARCLGLDDPKRQDDRADTRYSPYDLSTRVRALNLWGLILFHKLDYRQAVLKFEEAVRLVNDGPVDVRRELAFIYANWATVSVDGAFVDFRKAASRGTAQDEERKLNKEIEEAEKRFRQNASFEPKDAGSFNDYGYLLLRRMPAPRVEHAERAVDLFRKAVSYEVQAGEAYKGWGDAILATHAGGPSTAENEIWKDVPFSNWPERARAIEKYESAITKADPTFAAAYVKLALLQLQEPDPDRTVRTQTLYCRAVRLYLVDPGQFPFAQNPKDTRGNVELQGIELQELNALHHWLMRRNAAECRPYFDG